MSFRLQDNLKIWKILLKYKKKKQSFFYINKTDWVNRTDKFRRFNHTLNTIRTQKKVF